jgi:hypothetical protein
LPDSSSSLQWLLIAGAVLIIAAGVFFYLRSRSPKKGIPVTVSDERLKSAAESILGDESLTDEMTDVPAQRLLDWAVSKSKQLAEQTADMDDSTAQAQLDTTLQDLRRVIRQINKAVGALENNTPEDVGAAMQKALEAASKVAVLQPQASTDVNMMIESIKALPPEEALSTILTYIDKGISNGEAAQ